jgi:hypothetical protein
MGSIYLQALEIKRQVFGDDNSTIAIGLSNLAHLYADWGHDNKAKPIFQQALAILTKCVGEDHPDTMTVMGNLHALRLRMATKKKKKSNMAILREL